MFVVKLQYKNSNEVNYANENFIKERAELINGSGYCSIKSFVMSKPKAQKLYHELVMRNATNPDTQYGWYDDKTIHYLALVELSNYSPHSEYQVLEYREFK